MGDVVTGKAAGADTLVVEVEVTIVVEVLLLKDTLESSLTEVDMILPFS